MFEIDEKYEGVWIIQSDPACTSETKIADLNIGDSFIFNDTRYVKISDLGWYLGYLNCKSEQGEAFIHPNTNVMMVQ